MTNDDGDALSHSINTMRSSLEMHQKTTADILGILEKVDDRLSSLEQNMGPIRRVTEQLTLAEQNVIKTYDKMKKLHENFRILAEADAMIRKGLANRSVSPPPINLPPPISTLSTTPTNAEGGVSKGGSGVSASAAGGGSDAEDSSLEAYVEVVDRVAEAMSFLKRNIRMRSAEVTLRQLELKQQRLLSDMRDEIYRLLSSGSQSVITRTSTDYQASDPISADLSRKVKVMCEVMIRAGDVRWTEAYSKARSIKMEMAVRHFLIKQHQTEGLGSTAASSGSSGAIGGGVSPPLVVTSATGASAATTNPDLLGDVQAEGWIRYMQFMRELIRVEEVVFSRALPSSSQETITAFIDLVIPSVSKLCSDATEALDNILAKERNRGDQTITLLSLLKGFKQEMSALEAVLKPGGHASSALEQVTKVYHNLCRLTTTALGALADEVAADSTAPKNLPASGTVHVITSNTLRTFKRIMVYEDLFEELVNVVPQLPWETEDDRADEDETRLRIYANHLFLSLLRNLRAKADGYAKLEGTDALSAAGRPHLFLMNNAHYMNIAVHGSGYNDNPSKASGASSTPGRAAAGASSVTTIKRSPSIASMLSEAFLERLTAVIEQSREKFTQTIWAPLAEHTKETGLNLEYTKGTNILTLESGRLIKAKFSSFNTALEEIYQHQKQFSVPDVGLRTRLRQDAKAMVLEPYTAFYAKYSTVQFSKKHMEQYLRFPPKAVGTMIEELYSG